MRKVLLLLLVAMSVVSSVSAQVADPDDEFRAYCDRKLRMLERARNEAQDESAAGNFDEAVNILIKGLQDNMGQYGDLNPITNRLITHAYNMGTNVLAQVGTDIRGIKATGIALENFYDLIFRSAQNIDYRYYSCQGRRFCRYSYFEEFESDLLNMVSDMLNVVNDSLTFRDGPYIYGMGPSSAYLAAAEKISYAGYLELKQLIKSTLYSCQILDLKDISQDLATFNRQSRPEYLKARKIAEVYNDFSDIVNSLQYRTCH